MTNNVDNGLGSLCPSVIIISHSKQRRASEEESRLLSQAEVPKVSGKTATGVS